MQGTDWERRHCKRPSITNLWTRPIVEDEANIELKDYEGKTPLRHTMERIRKPNLYSDEHSNTDTVNSKALEIARLLSTDGLDHSA